jgi:hypothetical protein
MMIMNGTAKRSRLELAQDNLEKVRRNRDELDEQGAMLVSENDRLLTSIPVAALDAIQFPDMKTSVLIALRERLWRLPGVIQAVVDKREALEAQLADSDMALAAAVVEDAAAAAVAASAERANLAPQIDLILTDLAESWAGYWNAGQDLVAAMQKMGLDAGHGTRSDETNLQNAVRRASVSLALAVGQRKDHRNNSEARRIDEHTDGWSASSTLEAANATAPTTRLLRSASGQ